MALMYYRSNDGAGDANGYDDADVVDDWNEEVDGFDLARRIIYTITNGGELAQFAFT